MHWDRLGVAGKRCNTNRGSMYLLSCPRTSKSGSDVLEVVLREVKATGSREFKITAITLKQ